MNSSRLTEVIHAGDVSTFASLIEALDPSERREVLQSSSKEAVKHDQPAIFAQCLASGASAEYWDDHKLHSALAEHGTPATLAVLLDAGGINVTDEPNEHAGGNFLSFCVNYNNLPALRYLFEVRGYGVADMGPIYKGPHTPLYEAMMRGSPAMLAYLLDRGADPERAPGLLHLAAGDGRADLIRLLLDRGAVDADEVNGSHGMRPSGTALHRAAELRKLQSVRALLDKGADVSKLDADGQNVIERSQKDGEEWGDLVTELRQRGMLGRFGRE